MVIIKQCSSHALYFTLWCVSAPNLLFRRLVNTTNLTLDTGLIPYERYTLGIAFQNQLLQGPEERIGFHMLQSSKTRRALSLVELMMHTCTPTCTCSVVRSRLVCFVAVPPSPEGFHVVNAKSDQLTVAWQPPSPPHGVITQYEVKRWRDADVASPNHYVSVVALLSSWSDVLSDSTMIF